MTALANTAALDIGKCRQSRRPGDTLDVRRPGNAEALSRGGREVRVLVGGFLLRRVLPRKTNLAEVSPARFTRLVQAYNNTPRKCLGYRTPAEILAREVLPGFPLSRE